MSVSTPSYAVAMKQCARCREHLARDQFYTRETGKPSSWCKSCIKAGNKARFEAAGGSERQAQHMRRYRYGLTADTYDELLTEQGGLCAICRRPPDGRGRLHIDHDHATGKVRGLLCASCNMGLGQFRDDPDVLMAALTYLHFGFTQ